MQNEKKKNSRRWSSHVIETLIVFVAVALTLNVLQSIAPTLYEEPATPEPVVIVAANDSIDEAEALYNEAINLKDADDYDGALALVNAAIALHNTPPDSYFWTQAWLLGQTRQYTSAIAIYRELALIGDYPAYVFGGLCYNYGSMGDFDTATEYCEAAGRYTSHQQWSSDAMCYIFGFTGQYEEAIEKCNEWLVHTPHPYAYNNRSRAYLMLGNYGLAMRDANRALALNTDRPEMPFTNRGLAKIALGQYSDGFADLMAAYGADATYPDIYLGFALYHDRMGNRDDARANYCQYLDMAWVTPEESVLERIETLGGCR